MKKQSDIPDREELLGRMWALAGAKTNDAVKLTFFPEQQMKNIGKLNLEAVTELKRGNNGGVEVKFADRMKALETLYNLLEQDGDGKLAAFFQSVEEPAGREG